MPSVLRPPPASPALLAICSDLDETPDADTYFELMRFLNTTEETSMGPGVGLEVGNTIYFDMPPGHFSYWNTTEENREKIRALIRSGHIDVLHSFGDLATSRAHAARALEELKRHGCEVKVWVDHAQAVSNFGADIMLGHGDEPGHPVYHADLTFSYGIQYVWMGRVTSVIGQERPFSLTQLWSDLCPLSSAHGSLVSARTFTKECAKQILSRVGQRKYAPHRPNRILGRSRLRDGREVPEFLRCNPHPGGVSCADRGDQIHEVLTRNFLDRLAASRGACILYTHLGKLGAGENRRRFRPEVVRAFQLLAEYSRSGKIHVTTTRRLLDQLSSQSPGTESPSSVLSPLSSATRSPSSVVNSQLSTSEHSAPSSVLRPLSSVLCPLSSVLRPLSSGSSPLQFPDVR